MDQERLEELLRQYYEAEEASDPARNCPPFPAIYLHQTEGKPLGEYEAHVNSCDRCQKMLTVVQREYDKYQRSFKGKYDRIVKDIKAFFGR